MSYSGATKRERWTEAEVLALPFGEHNYFDRKSGGLLTNKSERAFEESMAKHLSAFANSGGGHLVLGVRDDSGFDGVPRMRGQSRETTREWLEKKLPFLVDVALKDLRVHEVEPSEPSAIPQGMVVIVVDVGDSALAPHQDVFSKFYYHRSGGHSVPAPHFYLRTLWQRETYPSGRVVRAWFDTVINPMLDVLERELDDLGKGKWHWDRYKKTLGPELQFVGQTSSGWSLNLEPFLDSYPEVRGILRRHDVLLQEAIQQVGQLFGAVRNSLALVAGYEKTRQDDVLRQIKERHHYSFAETSTLEQAMQTFFGTDDKNDHLAILAELVVNETGEYVSASSKTFAPYWNMCREGFLRILDEDSDVRACRVAADQCRVALLAAVESAIEQVRETRKQLSRDYGEPYVMDDPQPGGYGGLYPPRAFR